MRQRFYHDLPNDGSVYAFAELIKMSESGQKQSSQLCSAHVRFTPESGLILWHSDKSALCQHQTFSWCVATIDFHKRWICRFPMFCACRCHRQNPLPTIG